MSLFYILLRDLLILFLVLIIFVFYQFLINVLIGMSFIERDICPRILGFGDSKISKEI